MTQEFFDVDDYQDRKACLRAKRERVKKLRGAGKRVVLSILRNQQRGYSGFGTARDYSVRDVFMISIWD